MKHFRFDGEISGLFGFDHRWIVRLLLGIMVFTGAPQPAIALSVDFVESEPEALVIEEVAEECITQYTVTMTHFDDGEDAFGMGSTLDDAIQVIMTWTDYTSSEAEAMLEAAEKSQSQVLGAGFSESDASSFSSELKAEGASVTVTSVTSGDCTEEETTTEEPTTTENYDCSSYTLTLSNYDDGENAFGWGSTESDAAAVIVKWTDYSTSQAETLLSQGTSSTVAEIGSGLSKADATSYKSEMNAFDATLTTSTAGEDCADCSLSLGSTSESASSSSSTISISVASNFEQCDWTPPPSENRISISTGASGTGAGTVNLAVSDNTEITSRTGTVTVAGIGVTVTQDALACEYTLGSTSQTVESAGGSYSVAVSVNNDACALTASTSTSWMTITSGSSGSGAGTVEFTVDDASVAYDRSGTLTIAGVPFTVSQDGGYLYAESVDAEAVPLDISSITSDATVVEFGSMTLPDDETEISLTNTFTSPVVFMGPLSYNGSNPALVRMKDLASNTYNAYISEWNYLDQIHSDEQVSYLVVEEGAHDLDGKTLQAGNVSASDGDWSSVTFTQEFSSTPIVLTFIQTVGGGDGVATRVKNVSTTGFNVQMIEEESSNQAHNDETIGWIALEPGTFTYDGNTFEAKLVSGFSESWKTITFDNSFSEVNFFADMNSYNGSDECTLRFKSLGTSSVKVQIDEEQSNDDEVTHSNTDDVGYLVIGN